MSDPSIGALASSAPPPMNEEPISTTPPGNETLVCVCWPADAAEGPSDPGARALVERFGGSQGAGGTGEVADEMPEGGPSCSDEALKAIGACGIAVIAATGTAGAAAVLAGVMCAANLDSYIECTENQDRTR